MASELASLKASLASGELDKAAALLSALKIKLTEFPSLPPLFEPSPNAAAELALARDVFEQAVLLAVQRRDEAAFERHFAQLQPYYSAARHLLPPSPAEPLLVGLNLLRLLVQQRTAEFHCQLEQLGSAALAQPLVAHAVAVEQWLMEGSYQKVLSGAPAEPAAAWFTEALAATVREEVCACAAAAYDRLPLPLAAQLLRCDVAAARATAAEKGWAVEGEVIDFAAGERAEAALVPASNLILNSLAYARELERII